MNGHWKVQGKRTILSLIVTGLLLVAMVACSSIPAGNVANVAGVGSQAMQQEDETATTTRTPRPTRQARSTATPQEEEATTTESPASTDDDDPTAEADEATAETDDEATAETDDDPTAEADDEATTEADDEATTEADDDPTAEADDEVTTEATAEADDEATAETDNEAAGEEETPTPLSVTTDITDTREITGTDELTTTLEMTDDITETGSITETDVLTPTMVTTDTEAMTSTSAITETMPMTSTVAVTHGPLSGEASETSVVLWARGDMTGTIALEIAETDAFTEVVQYAAIDVKHENDFTGETQVTGLDAGEDYYYRVILPADAVTNTETLRTGRFITAPATATNHAFDFVFGACVGGQNYCRNQDDGWVIFNQMAAVDPDFFVLLGDSVYVDSACTEANNNVPGAEGPYSDLDGFRTRYRYHLEDEAYASFLAQTPVYVTWDDHEIRDNFGGPELQKEYPQLFNDGVQAYFEYWPISPTDDEYRIYRKVSYGGLADFFILDTRSYRDPNVNWDTNPRTQQPKTMLGAEQFAWLQEGLASSQATWKFIVTSVPLAYGTGFPQPEVDGFDGWANLGHRSGYETELMSLIFTIQSHGIKNVVFLTGDTHWPFAISYDPDRNNQPDFYEFGSSPMSALTLPPPENTVDPSYSSTLIDSTFNPTVLYEEGEYQGELFNFGHVSVDENGDVTFRVVDWQGEETFSQTFSPDE